MLSVVVSVVLLCSSLCFFLIVLGLPCCLGLLLLRRVLNLWFRFSFLSTTVVNVYLINEIHHFKKNN